MVKESGQTAHSRVCKLKTKELNQEFLSRYIPKRASDSYKGDYGRVLCIGGSVEMTGAITLAGKAALYSGAGLITVATHPKNFNVVHCASLEIMCIDYTDFETLKDNIKQSDTILVGPGMGRSDFSKALFEMVIQNITDEQYFIIDADGLYHLSQMNLEKIILPKQTILTPHLGEWERITGLSPNDLSDEQNITWQQQLNATVVLKSHQTQVFTAEVIYQNTAGNPGMAVGGMGDTLAGMIAGCVKQFENHTKSVASAVYLHSYIGDLLYENQYVVLPSQIIEHIPEVMNTFDT
ncbi:MAG TPA: NAD(P)H-hydrate dehydratase [Alloiococcus sp.]|nr:NAD(P)H-hydrate dehydratase [Alloiococcus sp.]